MGCPNARSSGCANGAPSGRDLERVVTDTQLAFGKSLVVICSSAFRDWMPSACAAHALTNA